MMDLIKSLQSDEDVAHTGRESSIDLENLLEMQDAAPVRKLLNMVMLLAIKDRASDIHFEPFEDEFKMRYRCDGVMYEMVPPPRHLATAMSTRIKVMANLDIAERRLPQDGRIELNVGGNAGRHARQHPAHHVRRGGRAAACSTRATSASTSTASAWSRTSSTRSAS